MKYIALRHEENVTWWVCDDQFVATFVTALYSGVFRSYVGLDDAVVLYDDLEFLIFFCGQIILGTLAKFARF